MRHRHRGHRGGRPARCCAQTSGPGGARRLRVAAVGAKAIAGNDRKSETRALHPRGYAATSLPQAPSVHLPLLGRTQGHGSGGSYPIASLPAQTVICVGHWSTSGPQIPNLGLSAWELACHAMPTTVCSPEAIYLVRECPPQTASDHAIGYVTGTSGLE
jgi:hypothetical protein